MERTQNILKGLPHALPSSSGARAPDYARPSFPTTRPRSSRGVTFHFGHKTISKRSGYSETPGHSTQASAHQGYIERPSAMNRR